MAVYTALDQAELEIWLRDHGVGALVEVRGVASGIENSNFFVTTRKVGRHREYVLTLFERLTADELPFYLVLMRFLAARGVPCPAPVSARDGALFSNLAGKPAALVTRLPGRPMMSPAASHCALIGATLARLHRAGRKFPLHQGNPRGLAWWQDTAGHVHDFLDQSRRVLLDSEIAHQSERWPAMAAKLPSGAIHADLFRDNALFIEAPCTFVASASEGDAGNKSNDAPQLGGIIDFYFAGCDAWLFDVAISANDWCIDLASGVFDATRLDAFLTGYAAVRPFTDAEADAWPLMLRAAALRFWLSRLSDLHRPRPAELLTPHDPAHFERVLTRRRDDETDGRLRLPPVASPSTSSPSRALRCKR